MDPTERDGASDPAARSRGADPTVREFAAERDELATRDLFVDMDLAEIGERVWSEDDLRELLHDHDVGAWVALARGAPAGFVSLKRLFRADLLRAELACASASRAVIDALLERLEVEAERAGGASVTLWQLERGLAAASLADRGWRPVRLYERMRLELGAPRAGVAAAEHGAPDEAAAGPAVDVRTAQGEPERRLAHELIEGALAGHWQHRRRGFEQFFAEEARSPGHDETLWYLARVGGEPAGALIAEATGERAQITWLGVLERQRRRGVAARLLAVALDELERRGVRLAEVTVDTENATRAGRVYERAGMSSWFHARQWQLQLGGSVRAREYGAR